MCTLNIAADKVEHNAGSRVQVTVADCAAVKHISIFPVVKENIYQQRPIGMLLNISIIFLNFLSLCRTCVNASVYFIIKDLVCYCLGIYLSQSIRSVLHAADQFFYLLRSLGHQNERIGIVCNGSRICVLVNLITIGIANGDHFPIITALSLAPLIKGITAVKYSAVISDGDILINFGTYIYGFIGAERLIFNRKAVRYNIFRISREGFGFISCERHKRSTAVAYFKGAYLFFLVHNEVKLMYGQGIILIRIGNSNVKGLSTGLGKFHRYDL